MKRILPEMILNAYAQTGLTPIKGAMLYKKRDMKCGCAFGALYTQRGMFDNDEDFKQEGHEIFELAKNEYGCDYMWGFIRGFDSKFTEVPNISVEDELNIGFQDGVNARIAVIESGLKFYGESK